MGAAFAGITAFVLAHAAWMSWSWIVRPFWQDECRHNLAILKAGSLRELISAIGFMGQPALESVLRWAFWFPMWGHQEFGLRLPSLVYYIIMLICGIWLAFRFLLRDGHARGYALFGALLLGLWMTTKPVEPWNAFEARHYAMVSLASLWWFSLAVLGERRSPVMWWLVSFLFANTHFFALPLIGAVGLLDAWDAARERGRRAAVPVLAAVALVWIATIGINRPAWLSLTGSPPGARVEWLPGVLAGARTYWEFVRYIFRTPWVVVAMWAGLLATVDRREVRRLLLCVLGFMPMFLVALSVKSNYLFAPRYFTPFFGAAFLTILLAMDRAPVLAAAVVKRFRLSPGQAIAVRWAGLAALCFLFKVGAAGMHVAHLHERLFPATPNGSPTFHTYEAIKRIDKPVLVISELCWNDVTHELYFRFIGTPFRREVRLLRAGACGGDGTGVTRGISRFLADVPDGLVVLDQTDIGENICGRQPARRLRGGLNIRKAPDDQCAWFVEGVRTSADLKQAARAVEFRSLEWWYGR